MAGPTRTSQPASGSPRECDVQPPRPPNAWILYRSHHFALLRQSSERLSQADVSKRVASMWKNEAEPVKRHFELLAEEEKIKHQQMYPDYRFRPRRKEVKSRSKEEIRESRRAKKARAREATTPNAFVPATALPAIPAISQQYLPSANAPVIPVPQHFAFPPGVYYGPYGPSPPMSAAPSPLETSQSPQSSSDETGASSASPASGSELQVSSRLTTNQYYTPRPTSNRPSSNMYAHQPQSTQLFQPSVANGQTPNPPVPSSEITVPQGPTVWNNTHRRFPNLLPHNSRLVKLDLPITETESLVGSQRAISSGSQFNSMLSTTNQNGIINLANVDNRNAGVRPMGNLQVAMGPPAPTVDYNGQHFADYDFIEFQKQIASLLGECLDSPKPATSPVPQETHCPNNTELDAYNATQQRQPSAFTQDMMSYLNFDAVDDATDDTSATPSLPVPTTVAPQQVRVENTQQAATMPIFTQMTNAPAPSTPSSSYVPPAGAIYSSTRRVAGSWKPPFVDYTLTEDSVHSWTFPN